MAWPSKRPGTWTGRPSRPSWTCPCCSSWGPWRASSLETSCSCWSEWCAREAVGLCWEEGGRGAIVGQSSP